MSKVLKNVLISILLLVMLFALTGCGKEEVNGGFGPNPDAVEVVEDSEDDVVASIGDGKFDGIYVAGSETDPMEGLAIIPIPNNAADKMVFIKDSSGSGAVLVGAEDIKGDKMSQELAGEVFTITDLGANVKIEHPMFTYGEEVEMVPGSADFAGIYEKDDTVLVVIKDIKGNYIVAYINTRYETSTSLTFADCTINGNVLEGKDDVYSEPIKLTLNGEVLSVEITSEDSRWNSANTDFTLVKY